MFRFPVFTEFLCVAVFSVVVFSSYGLGFFSIMNDTSNRTMLRVCCYVSKEADCGD